MSNYPNLPDLPVKEVLPQLATALANSNNAVLVAPPGAGKTTLVPLALLDVEWRKDRKIIVLEPRRLAARGAATRMAQLLGEDVGDTVGYRVRFDTKISQNTIIEVVTEGVFARMLASDPGLENVAAILFDEFHERSLDGDLSLALCLDLQSGLREDLRLLPMSATMDGSAVAKLMNAKIIKSEGRQFPVEVSYEELAPREKLEPALAQILLREIKGDGNILAFLPGQREIERTADLVAPKLPDGVELHRLYGAISQKEQAAAIAPSKDGIRKIVLSSAIAETSLTIDGVHTVVDSGLARLPVFEPATGLTRLQTVRASKAAIDQRAGRAGRLGPGRAIRMWREQQTAALPAYAPPEITNADLSALVLDLADWGVSDPSTLLWLDAPPAPALNEANTLLENLGAFTNGNLTAHGRAIHKLPLPPRLAHMVVKAASLGNGLKAANLALVLQERGVGGRNVDLDERYRNLRRASDPRSKKIIAQARKIVKPLDGKTVEELSSGVLLSFAYSDRIAQRGGKTPHGNLRYRLANGRGAELEADHRLATLEFIVVADMIGKAGAARILSAAEISKSEIEDYFGDQISTKTSTVFDKKSGSLNSHRASKLGALLLSKPQRVEGNAQSTLQALLDAVQKYGLELLPWSKSDTNLRNKLAFLHLHLPDQWPSMDDAILLAKLDEWVAPFLMDCSSFKAMPNGALSDGLMMLAGMGREREIAQLIPSHFTVPSGSSIPIRYEKDKSVLAVRPQELFGLALHPTIMNGTVPLELELLSPAGRPIQITLDLPGFWQGSWKGVRADLRGRYPKHPWPEDPLSEPPTKRIKPRKK